MINPGLTRDTLTLLLLRSKYKLSAKLDKALSSFAESLYFDLKRSNVRVSLVSPGFIKTPMTDQNDFPMPMIKSPEFAAEQMFKGLTKSKGFEIHFPKSFTTIMKVLKVIPNGLYFKILEKGMKRIKD